jgi:RNA polymerase sigma factor (sigma-70 family)
MPRNVGQGKMDERADERRVDDVEALLDRARCGDAAAWEAIVERFAGVDWAAANTFRLHAIDAADVSQTTWLRLVQHLDRIEHPDRLAGWLATTARRESLRVLRMAGRQVPVPDPEVIDLRESTSGGADRDCLVAERDELLDELFLRLPARCRQILASFYDDSPSSYRELAALLDMPIGSVGPTRARCLEHLRRLAQTAGLASADRAS